ncbi:MAG: PTS system N-acetylglucosamine-specific IIC component [Psychromonas sp.]|jgi:PTS system N-acetylglucosamine-specific IIC component|uniref:PTS transporter subunit EIIB n=1 Tax=Psychromonas sp. TaxID=1884585 RepID=UPI0039E5636E
MSIVDKFQKMGETLKDLELEKPDFENEQASGKKAPVSDAAEQLAIQYVAAIGGINNLEAIDVCLTRLRLTLKDLGLINETELRGLGAMGIVKIGENNLQVIIGPQAEGISNALKALKKQS